MENYLLKFKVDLITDTIVDFKNKDDIGLPFSLFFDKYMSEQSLEMMEVDYCYEVILNIVHNHYNFVCKFITRNATALYSITAEVKNNISSVIFKKDSELSEDMYSLYKDSLTSLYNRAYLVERVTNILRCKNNALCAMVVIDLNDFKKVNDNCGHRAGDECLRMVAVQLREICHGHILARYGGDEFVVFMTNVYVEHVKKVCQELVNMKVRISNNNKRYTVTCCCGVSMMNESEASFSSMFEMADSSLYIAKEHGKHSAYHKNESIASYKESRKKYQKKKNWKKSKLFKEELNIRIARYGTIAGLLAIGVLVCSIISSVFLTRQNNRNIVSEANNALNTVSFQINQSVSTSIDSWYDELGLISSFIEEHSTDSTDIHTLDDHLDRINKQISFESVALLLENGVLYFGSNNQYNIFSENISSEIIIDEDKYIDCIYMENLGERIIFGIPTDFNVVGALSDTTSTNVSGIVGISTIDSFSSLLESTAFESSTNIDIVNNDGGIIIRSDNNSYETNNIFKLLKQNMSANDSLLIENDIISGKTGIRNIYLEKEHFLIYYSSLFSESATEFNSEWRIVIMVPYSQVLSRTSNTINQLGNVLINFSITLCCVVAIAASFLLFAFKKYLLAKYIDPLTKGINLDRFYIDSGRLINKNNRYVLAYINFNRYKFIKEEVGNHISNKIITTSFNIIQSKLENYELVAHVYGDRFVVLIRNDSFDLVNKKLNDIALAIKSSVGSNYGINLYISIGAYFVNESDKKDVKEYIDRAHIALDKNKINSDSIAINYFTEKMLIDQIENNEIESSAEFALNSGQFEVYYQAKWDLMNSKWYGAEALVRWKNPHRGNIPPNKFIPLFEKNGFIIKMDFYVFEKVCHDLKKLINKGIKPLPVSVNLSRNHFLDDTLMPRLVEIANKYDIPGELIEFELTEDSLIVNPMILRQAITKMHNNNCVVSLDDFGSGYSSLNMMKDYEFDTIKLDRIFFVSDNPDKENSKEIVKSIVSLSHRLGKKVVAEGPEDEDLITFLKSIECDYVQSFYYAKPVSFSEYIKKVGLSDDE